MRLAISGTYSAGKTLLSIALSHYLGLPRSRARTMRELLPVAVPGKALEQCTAAELIQLIVARHVDRALHESRLGDAFVSDGSSLQEWVYGSIRVTVGINPNESAHLGATQRVPRTPELTIFDDVLQRLGVTMKQHVLDTYDAVVHLPNELPMVPDGHRPVNDRFRQLADRMLFAEVVSLGIPVRLVGGSLAERLTRTARVLDLTPVLDVREAVALAQHDYQRANALINGLREPETVR
jgi:hypothetical protein